MFKNFLYKLMIISQIFGKNYSIYIISLEHGSFDYILDGPK